MITWHPDAADMQAALDGRGEPGESLRAPRFENPLLPYVSIVLLGLAFAWAALVPYAVHLGELAGRWLS